MIFVGNWSVPGTEGSSLVYWHILGTLPWHPGESRLSQADGSHSSGFVGFKDYIKRELQSELNLWCQPETRIPGILT